MQDSAGASARVPENWRMPPAPRS